LFLGAIVVPLCALRGYFIWVRSHWYRWIGEGIKEDYEEGESAVVISQAKASPSK
jgi:hypothetical protein